MVVLLHYGIIGHGSKCHRYKIQADELDMNMLLPSNSDLNLIVSLRQQPSVIEAT